MKQLPLTNDTLSALCLELSLLLRAGIGAGDGLHLLAEESESDLQALLRALAERVESGAPLAVALRESARFPAYLTGLVEVGERSGRTEEALGALSRYYDQRRRLDRYVRSALLYPALLLVLMLVVIVVLLARVLPVFDDVYASLGGQLTGVAGGLLTLGRGLDAAMPLLCVLLALTVGFLAAFAGWDRFRAAVLTWWNRRFGDRGVSRKLSTARFAQALAMGLTSGLPVGEALQLAASLQTDVPAAAARYQDCQTRLSAGADLAEALRQSDLFPAGACRLLALGLRSGDGDTVLAELSRRLSEDAQQALEDQISRVEPTLVIATSLLVGLILLSVMLPLMHIMSAIG
ncbi:MAG: type II secretion system F family protein [Oscillibacter sp.]